MSENEDIEKSDEINILYKIDRRKKAFRLFNNYFVENNNDKCYIIIEGKEHNLKEYLLIKDIKTNSKNIEIILNGFNNI